MRTLRERVIDELNGRKHTSRLLSVGGVLAFVGTVTVTVIHHYKNAIDSKSHMLEVFFLIIGLIVFAWWALIGRKK